MLHIFQWEPQKLQSPPLKKMLSFCLDCHLLYFGRYMCVKQTPLWADLQCQWFRLNLRPQITDPRTGSIYLHCWGYSKLNTNCPQVVQTLRAYWNIICLPFTPVMDKQPICYLKFSLFMRALITSPVLSSRLEHWSLRGLSSVPRECCSAHGVQREVMKCSSGPLLCDACLKTSRIPRTHKTMQFLQRSVQLCYKCWTEGGKKNIIGKVFIFIRILLLRMMFALTGK